MSRTIHIAVCSFFLIVFGYAQHAGAANWQLLQGSEPASAGKLRIWGFVQGSYQKDFSDPKARRAAYESCAVKGEVMAGASPEYQNAAFEHLATLLPKLD